MLWNQPGLVRRASLALAARARPVRERLSVGPLTESYSRRTPVPSPGFVTASSPSDLGGCSSSERSVGGRTDRREIVRAADADHRPKGRHRSGSLPRSRA